MKHFFVGFIALALFSGFVAGQSTSIFPSRGLPGDSFTITPKTRGPDQSCWWHLWRSIGTEQELLGRVDEPTDTLEANVPNNATPGSIYAIHCGPTSRLFEEVGYLGLFEVDPPVITQLLQPEIYFDTEPIRMQTGDVGQIRQEGNQFVVDVRFANDLSQILNMRVRSESVQALQEYVQNVRVYFETILANEFHLDQDVATNQVPGRLSDKATISVSLTLLSAGERSQGLANYLTYFRIDPLVGNEEQHDYIATDQESVAVRATSTAGQVRLTMWRIEPTTPELYANSDTTRNDGQTSWLKNALEDGTGTYMARVTGMVLGDSEYELDGSFEEPVCPPLDCETQPNVDPPPPVCYAEIDYPEEVGYVNVRSVPGVLDERNVALILFRGDPIAIVAHARPSGGGQWVRMYAHEPRWFNLRFADHDCNIESLPNEPDNWSLVPATQELTLGESVDGFVSNEYGQMWTFENIPSGLYNIRTEAEVPGSIRVSVSTRGSNEVYPFESGVSNISLRTSSNELDYRLLVRFNEGATGSYRLTMTLQN